MAHIRFHIAMCETPNLKLAELSTLNKAESCYMICMLTLQIHGYNNRGDEDDQRGSSTGRRKSDEGDGALWFVYSTDRDRGVYQDPGAGVSVYAAAFVYDVGGAYLRESKRGLLGGAVCASWARRGAGLYGGRRAFVYFPADVWIPHRVHRGCMADGLDLREERGLLFRQDSFCKSGGAPGGVSFRDGVCVHHQ